MSCLANMERSLHVTGGTHSSECVNNTIFITLKLTKFSKIEIFWTQLD